MDDTLYMMKRLRNVETNCLACGEPIDDFHETWFFADSTHEMRLHARCGSHWEALTSGSKGGKRPAAFRAPRSPSQAVVRQA